MKSFFSIIFLSTAIHGNTFIEIEYFDNKSLEISQKTKSIIEKKFELGLENSSIQLIDVSAPCDLKRNSDAYIRFCISKYYELNLREQIHPMILDKIKSLKYYRVPNVKSLPIREAI